MEDATNGTGFDLVINIVSTQDEVSPTKSLRDSMSVLGMLGTWVIVAERESQVSIDPPEANLLHSKRVSVVFGQLTADLIIDCRMYDGIVLNIMEEILNQFLKGTFNLLS